MEIKKVLQYKLTDEEVQALNTTVNILDNFCQKQSKEGCKDCILDWCCSQLTDKDESCSIFVENIVFELLENQYEEDEND